MSLVEGTRPDLANSVALENLFTEDEVRVKRDWRCYEKWLI